MVEIIASYLLSDTEFNLTIFSTLLHCKDGWGGICPKCPMLDPPMLHVQLVLRISFKFHCIKNVTYYHTPVSNKHLNYIYNEVLYLSPNSTSDTAPN